MEVNFEMMQELARRAVPFGLELGFDWLEVRAVHRRELGVRVALGEVCRENVLRDEHLLAVSATLERKTSGFESPWVGWDDLARRLRALRESIALQSPDGECVLPASPDGSFAWQVPKSPFDALYSPAILYSLLAAHLARAREKGLRVSGYVGAMEKRCHAFAASRLSAGAGAVAGAGMGFDLFTHDHGISMKFTVDNPGTGAVGSGLRASTCASRAEIDEMMRGAFDEAIHICEESEDPQDPTLGDHCAVFSPKAVADLMGSLVGYGMFDRRKIDEGRTFLSRHHGPGAQALAFPRQLALTQGPHLSLGAVQHSDSPFNDRGTLCAPLNLVAHGAVRDLHTCPFWAGKSGFQETYSAHEGVPLTLGWNADAADAVDAELPPDVEALIRNTERGVYVAGVWYLRLVSEMDGVLTGMTRDGLFAIEEGKITRPLKNMRWHENPLGLLSRVSGVSRERSLFGLSRLAGGWGLSLMPAVRFERFHFSSVTKF